MQTAPRFSVELLGNTSGVSSALIETRNPRSRLAAIRDPMTIVSDMLRWDAAEALLMSVRCLDVRTVADRAWCIETMMHLMRTGLTFGLIWTQYTFGANTLTMHCVLDGVIPRHTPGRYVDAVSVVATTLPSWLVQDGPAASYDTRAEWIAAIAKYKVQ